MDATNFLFRYARVPSQWACNFKTLKFEKQADSFYSLFYQIQLTSFLFNLHLPCNHSNVSTQNPPPSLTLFHHFLNLISISNTHYSIHQISNPNSLSFTYIFTLISSNVERHLFFFSSIHFSKLDKTHGV